MIDRQNRDRLIAAITRYMDEQITAFAFDEEIQDIRYETKDKTVAFVVRSLWFLYDDCKDHLAGLSKQEWDYFQRLILLLQSSAEVEQTTRRRWTIRQTVAAAALLGFCFCATWLGIGLQLLAVALPFGPVSILLAHWRDRSDRKRGQADPSLLPFSSFSELRAIWRKTTGFSKRRHPSWVKVRRVHGRLSTAAVWANSFFLWSMFSPLVLFFQLFPDKVVTIRIREGAANPAC